MTHYSTLGVADTATPDEIKKAYRKLAGQYHPDKEGGDKTRFQEVQKAYEVLSDPQKKQQYDMERSGRLPGGFRFTVNGQDVDRVPGGMDDLFRNFGFNFGGGVVLRSIIAYNNFQVARIILISN